MKCGRQAVLNFPSSEIPTDAFLFHEAQGYRLHGGLAKQTGWETGSQDQEAGQDKTLFRHWDGQTWAGQPLADSLAQLGFHVGHYKKELLCLCRLSTPFFGPS